MNANEYNKCGKCNESAKNGRHGVGRKFFGLFVCLAALVVCAYFRLDVSMGVVGLYGLYVGSNVTQKIGTSYTDALAGRFEREHKETSIGGGR